jgi:hypothetical protein
MFQYAAGRSVALQTGRRLVLDPTAIRRGSSVRRYELSSFRIEGEPIGWLRRATIRAQVGARVPAFLRAAACTVSSDVYTLLRDEGHVVDERLFTLTGHLVLEGCWQSVAYVERDKEVARRLRREFDLRQPLPAHLAALAAELDACESVCVHVRRGDYVSDEQIALVHGALSLDYYGAAAEVIESRVEKARYFVFSDDLPWAREHVMLGGPMRFLDAAARFSPAVEQRLLACCNIFIIANSTFCWWAAWLGEAPGTIVVAPQRWFATAEARDGLIPPRWIRA